MRRNQQPQQPNDAIRDLARRMLALERRMNALPIGWRFIDHQGELYARNIESGAIRGPFPGDGF